MSNQRDTIFKTHQSSIADFAFDAKVADVFPDMISRSVPGYTSIISSIGLLASERVTAGSRCYDLGCSLGAATLAMRQNIEQKDCQIIAVDNAPAMVERCEKIVADDSGDIPVSVHCENIEQTEIANASMVVMNFTLQFVSPELRGDLVAKIYNGLNPGGIFLLSEKLAFDDKHIQQLQIEMHHRFKRANGYSDLEISQKRNALENVLIPETLATHKDRLHSAGFASVELWFQCFNFASMIAIK